MEAMTSTVIDYRSRPDRTTGYPRARLALPLIAALLCLLFAGTSALRAANQWSLIRQSPTGGTGCGTCDQQLKQRLNVKQATFADHLSVFVLTSGGSLVCVIGATRAYYSIPARPLRR